MKGIFVLCFVMLACNPSRDLTRSVAIHNGTEKYFNPALKPFYHGVASGDPKPHSVLIWTRITPDKTENNVPVNWEFARDLTFDDIVANGSTDALRENDFAIKLRVKGLEPGSNYFYRFNIAGVNSSVGRTKTAPEGRSTELKFAIISCSNFEAGYYNALSRISEIPDLDAVVHLGDYIYEYGPDVYGDKSLDRKHLPGSEIISLNDYRTRYAQYRLDRDFQRVHQMHPFISIWDDHEISNNSYVEGAQNHDEEREGAYESRKQAARKAYDEWMPMEYQDRGRLFRKLEYGDLLDWIMLDERLEGRTKQVKSDTSAAYLDPSRSMLGKPQLDWFKTQLSQSDAIWKLIGNQVIFSDVSFASYGWNKNMDAWDGYPVEKDNIIHYLIDDQIPNVVFLTGDTHSSWAFEVPIDIPDYLHNGRVAAFEFGTPSVTSANSNEGRSDEEVIEGEFNLKQDNPHLKYTNMRDHGYLLLTVRETEIIAEWYYVDTIHKRSIRQHLGKKLRVLRRGKSIVK